MKVRDIMKQAHVVDKDISFGEAAKIMSSLDIGSLIIVEDKKNDWNCSGGSSGRHRNKVVLGR